MDTITAVELRWLEADARKSNGRSTAYSNGLARAADAIERLERERDEARKSWRCFHCDEVFASEHEARLHFGRDEGREPGCCIKVGAERGLLQAMRRAEDDAAEAWFRLQNESGEAAKAYYAQNSRHQEQLRVAEEAGYERGLRDAAHEATRAEAAESERRHLPARVAKMEEAVKALSPPKALTEAMEFTGLSAETLLAVRDYINKPTP